MNFSKELFDFLKKNHFINQESTYDDIISKLSTTKKNLSYILWIIIIFVEICVIGLISSIGSLVYESTKISNYIPPEYFVSIFSVIWSVVNFGLSYKSENDWKVSKRDSDTLYSLSSGGFFVLGAAISGILGVDNEENKTLLYVCISATIATLGILFYRSEPISEENYRYNDGYGTLSTIVYGLWATYFSIEAEKVTLFLFLSLIPYLLSVIPYNNFMIEWFYNKFNINVNYVIFSYTSSIVLLIFSGIIYSFSNLMSIDNHSNFIKNLLIYSFVEILFPTFMFFMNNKKIKNSMIPIFVNSWIISLITTFHFLGNDILSWIIVTCITTGMGFGTIKLSL